ncbi:hypothetical protein SD15574_3927 [Shigella dysenteriae 155-74]|nr:hypothetical protein SD15574_3927 [Shigella dysenteriae 155-74]
MGDEPSSGNDLPTEKVSQTTLQIIPEGSVADMRRAWRNGPVAVCDGGPYWI